LIHRRLITGLGGLGVLGNIGSHEAQHLLFQLRIASVITQNRPMKVT
jgi:hypothetical protein